MTANVENFCGLRGLRLLLFCSERRWAWRQSFLEDFAGAGLKGFLELPGGIPSHDTFNRILQLIDPEQLEEVMGKMLKL